MSFAGVFAGGRLLGEAFSRYHRTWYPRAGNACYSETADAPADLRRRVVALLTRSRVGGAVRARADRDCQRPLARDRHEPAAVRLDRARDRRRSQPSVGVVPAPPRRRPRPGDGHLGRVLPVDGRRSAPRLVAVARRQPLGGGCACCVRALASCTPSAVARIRGREWRGWSSWAGSRFLPVALLVGCLVPLGAGCRRWWSGRDRTGSRSPRISATAGIETVSFGEPLESWYAHMPAGMLLRSRRRSSHIADPRQALTIGAYERASGSRVSDPTITLEEFVDYGRWFQRTAVPDVDPRRVTAVGARRRRVRRAGRRWRGDRRLARDRGRGAVAVHGPPGAVRRAAGGGLLAFV